MYHQLECIVGSASFSQVRRLCKHASSRTHSSLAVWGIAVSQLFVEHPLSTIKKSKLTSSTAQSPFPSLASIYCIRTHFAHHRQLTKLPPNAGRKFARACVDSPNEADTFEMKLRDGDIVVAYVRTLSSQPLLSRFSDVHLIPDRPTASRITFFQ